LIKSKKDFIKQKSELYKVHKLRHSIICGIPCIYVNPNKENIEIGRKFEEIPLNCIKKPDFEII